MNYICSVQLQCLKTQPKSGFLCYIHESPQCSSEEKTQVISTNLVKEKRLFFIFKKIPINWVVHLDTKLSVLSHMIQEAGWKGKEFSWTGTWSQFICVSDEFDQMNQEISSLKEHLLPHCNQAKLKLLPSKEGYIKLTREENFPLSPNWCESQTKLSPCT